MFDVDALVKEVNEIEHMVDENAKKDTDPEVKTTRMRRSSIYKLLIYLSYTSSHKTYNCIKRYLSSQPSTLSG